MCCTDKATRRGRCSYCMLLEVELTRSPLDICFRCSDYLGPHDRRKLCGIRCVEAVGLLAYGHGDGIRRGTVGLLFRRGWVRGAPWLPEALVLTKTGRRIAEQRGYKVRRVR